MEGCGFEAAGSIQNTATTKTPARPAIPPQTSSVPLAIVLQSILYIHLHPLLSHSILTHLIKLARLLSSLLANKRVASIAAGSGVSSDADAYSHLELHLHHIDNTYIINPRQQYC